MYMHEKMLRIYQTSTLPTTSSNYSDRCTSVTNIIFATIDPKSRSGISINFGSRMLSQLVLSPICFSLVPIAKWNIESWVWPGDKAIPVSLRHSFALLLSSTLHWGLPDFLPMFTKHRLCNMTYMYTCTLFILTKILSSPYIHVSVIFSYVYKSLSFNWEQSSCYHWGPIEDSIRGCMLEH